MPLLSPLCLCLNRPCLSPPILRYVDDVVAGIVKAMEWRSADGGPQVFNFGNTAPVTLLDFIRTLERVLGKAASLVDGGPSPGEVGTTFSDNTLSRAVLGFVPRVGLDDGAARFAAWFRSPARRPEFATVATRRKR